jgi:hypothetical protein
MALPTTSDIKTTSSGMQYIGNPDFRGYLAAKAVQGDTQAQQAVFGYGGLGYAWRWN